MSSSQLTDTSVTKVIEKALQRGLDLRRYKPNFVKRRLDARLRSLKLGDYTEYASFLDRNPAECAALYKNLSINVTEFFRNKPVFDAFSSKIIPELIAKKGSDKEIKVWSAGCSSGEEPYGIAMLLDDALRNTNYRFKIIATDVSEKIIQVAKTAKYPATSLVNVPEKFTAKYFRPAPENGYFELSREIRDYVMFDVKDIMNLNANGFDAIFCRNVLIYYGKPAQQLIFAKFHNSLKTPGYLVIGMDEILNSQSAKLFETMLSRERVYRKRATT